MNNLEQQNGQIISLAGPFWKTLIAKSPDLEIPMNVDVDGDDIGYSRIWQSKKVILCKQLKFFIISDREENKRVDYDSVDRELGKHLDLHLPKMSYKDTILSPVVGHTEFLTPLNINNRSHIEYFTGEILKVKWADRLWGTNCPTGSLQTNNLIEFTDDYEWGIVTTAAYRDFYSTEDIGSINDVNDVASFLNRHKLDPHFLKGYLRNISYQPLRMDTIFDDNVDIVQ